MNKNKIKNTKKYKILYCKRMKIMIRNKNNNYNQIIDQFLKE